MPSGGTESYGSNRVNRGGSWNNNAENCAVSNRNSNSPDNRNNKLGFRLVRSAQLTLWSGNLAAGRKKQTGFRWRPLRAAHALAQTIWVNRKTSCGTFMLCMDCSPQTYMARRCW